MKLLADSAEGVGYLLKDRISDVAEFVAAVRAGGRRRLGARPDHRLDAALAAAARRPAGAAHAARARGAGADGDGQLQPGHRRRAGDHAAGRREVRLEHLRQARPAVERAASRAASWRCCCTCAPATRSRTARSRTATPIDQKPEPCGPPACRLGARDRAATFGSVPSDPLRGGSHANPHHPAQAQSPDANQRRTGAPTAGRPAAPGNLAARMGRWSATHRTKAILDLGPVRRRGRRGRRDAPDVADRQERRQGRRRGGSRRRHPRVVVRHRRGGPRRVRARAVRRRSPSTTRPSEPRSPTSNAPSPAFDEVDGAALAARRRQQRADLPRPPRGHGVVRPAGDLRRGGALHRRHHRRRRRRPEAHPDMYIGNAGVSTEKAARGDIKGRITKAGLIAVAADDPDPACSCSAR